jgi:hypothetical protein
MDPRSGVKKSRQGRLPLSLVRIRFCGSSVLHFQTTKLPGSATLQFVIPPAPLRPGLPWGLPWEQPTCLWQVKGGMNERSELHFVTRPQTNLSSRLPRPAVGPERSEVEGPAVPSTSSWCQPKRYPPLCHPACPGLPWDRSVPEFLLRCPEQIHVCGLLQGRPHEVRQRHQPRQEFGGA